jgi:membrane protein implicated in regulation of membrane protease activity
VSRSRRPRPPLVKELALPKRPFRDSAIFNAVLALIVVGVAWFTGGELPRAVIIALAFFVLATAWSWWRFRARIDAERRAEAKRP